MRVVILEIDQRLQVQDLDLTATPGHEILFVQPVSEWKNLNLKDMLNKKRKKKHTPSP